MSVFGKNFNAAIFSDTINMIIVKLCMVVSLIERYPFIPLSVTFIIYISKSQQCQTVSSIKIMFLSD